ncbi:hypothetical protein MAR_003965 [Mya arenaria]|uniref:Uncharacterized protein n=1 Tax=Mya arenaria TaxID=6604 RepID=A0ABY7EVJ5_MYAAR|nr:hypothetical protein MAR_003965 [Mya arenaria]
MDDIVEDRACLTVENYEAIAIIKTTLKKKKEKLTTMKDLWKKFTNKCSPQFECMRKCLRREREFKRKNHKLRIHATDSFQGPKSQ